MLQIEEVKVSLTRKSYEKKLKLVFRVGEGSINGGK